MRYMDKLASEVQQAGAKIPAIAYQLGSHAIRTRHGQMIDGSMVGAPLPVPADSRWDRWAANPTHSSSPEGITEVWLSAVYLVQVFQHPQEQWKRLSIRRINGRDICEGWNELQSIKNDIAGVDSLAIEVFPAQHQLVDVAPMRHLWVVPAGFDLPCVWKRAKEKS